MSLIWWVASLDLLAWPATFVSLVFSIFALARISALSASAVAEPSVRSFSAPLTWPVSLVLFVSFGLVVSLVLASVATFPFVLVVAFAFSSIATFALLVCFLVGTGRMSFLTRVAFFLVAAALDGFFFFFGSEEPAPRCSHPPSNSIESSELVSSTGAGSEKILDSFLFSALLLLTSLIPSSIDSQYESAEVSFYPNKCNIW